MKSIDTAHTRTTSVRLVGAFACGLFHVPSSTSTDDASNGASASSRAIETAETDPSFAITPTASETDSMAGATESLEPESANDSMVCQPITGDDECAACTKTNCCEELTACLADTECGCVVTCIDRLQSPNPLEAVAECQTQCDTAGGVTWAAQRNCVASRCLLRCV